MFLGEISALSSLNHRNLLKIVGFRRSTDQNMCGTSFVVDFYVEFHRHNLLIELNNRKNCQVQDFFEEHELWYLIESIVSACTYLEQNRIFHGDLSPVQVTLTETGFAKIGDHGLLNSFKNAYNKVLSGKKIQISPELMEALRVRNSQPDYQVYKNDVYSLGMTLLHAATLEDPVQNCYDFSSH